MKTRKPNIERLIELLQKRFGAALEVIQPVKEKNRILLFFVHNLYSDVSLIIEYFVDCNVIFLDHDISRLDPKLRSSLYEFCRKREIIFYACCPIDLQYNYFSNKY